MTHDELKAILARNAEVVKTVNDDSEKLKADYLREHAKFKKGDYVRGVKENSEMRGTILEALYDDVEVEPVIVYSVAPDRKACPSWDDYPIILWKETDLELFPTIKDYSLGNLTTYKAGDKTFQEHIDDWVRINQQDRSKVYHGVFPLGMVGGWIDRALRAEAQLKQTAGPPDVSPPSAWTTSIPTRSGVYWRREGNGAAVISHVYVGTDAAYRLLVCNWTRFTDSFICKMEPVTEQPDVWWQEPLQPRS